MEQSGRVTNVKFLYRFYNLQFEREQKKIRVRKGNGYSLFLPFYKSVNFQTMRFFINPFHYLYIYKYSDRVWKTVLTICKNSSSCIWRLIYIAGRYIYGVLSISCICCFSWSSPCLCFYMSSWEEGHSRFRWWRIQVCFLHGRDPQLWSSCYRW
jgi:hypothetical protein